MYLSPLAANAQRNPDGLALTDRSKSLTWRELHDLVMRGARAMAAMRAPARVAVFAANSVETIVVHLCALYSGTSLVPVNPQLTAPEASWQLADSGAALVLASAETAQVALAAVELAGRGQVVAWGNPTPPGVHGWEGWLHSAPLAQPGPHLPARPFLHYTSGTTGKPKATETPPVMFPHGMTVAGLLDHLRAGVEAGVAGPVLLVGPSYHTGPMTSIRELAGGRPMVVMQRFDAEQLLVLVERYRIAMAVMVPTHFQRLLALPEEVRSRYDVSSLVFVPHTGSSCPVKVKQAMINWFGPVLIEGYGGTECGTTCIITSEEWLGKPGSVGKAVAPFEALVVDDAGLSLPCGTVGKLFFRDTTGRGIEYLNDPEKTDAAHIEAGIFTLGDVGYVDEDGFVFITDRDADMIVSGGVNIYPAEIEQAILRLPEVVDAAAIGVPNPDFGEEVKAMVVLGPGSSLNEGSLLDAIKASLAAYKLPKTIEFVKSIERNAMGKLNKQELRKRYWPTDRTISG